MLGRAMRAHQAKDRDELEHSDVYGGNQLATDFFNTVCMPSSSHQATALNRGGPPPSIRLFVPQAHDQTGRLLCLPTRRVISNFIYSVTVVVCFLAGKVHAPMPTRSNAPAFGYGGFCRR